MQRDALRQALLSVLQDETWQQFENLNDQTDLRQGLNLDSVDMVSLILTIQTRFRIDISNDELLHVATVGDLLDLLQAKIAAAPGSQAA